MDPRAWELLIDRLEHIERSITSLDKKVASVVNFKWWILGAAGIMSFGSSTIVGTLSEGKRVDNSEVYLGIPEHPPSILLDKQDARNFRSKDAPMEKRRNEEGSLRHSRGSSVGSVPGDRGEDPNG